MNCMRTIIFRLYIPFMAEQVHFKRKSHLMVLWDSIPFMFSKLRLESFPAFSGQPLDAAKTSMHFS